MYREILEILEKYKNGELNLTSESDRDILAQKIEKRLIQQQQINTIVRELYEGEG